MEFSNARSQGKNLNSKPIRYRTSNFEQQQQGQSLFELSLCLLILSSLALMSNLANKKIEKEIYVELKKYQTEWNRIQKNTAR
ncbi:MAG: hypothetical protein Fur0010_19560 [Bdellovibrio sp.]